MEIFGIGILELILILLVAIIVLGPDGMVKAAHDVGRWLRKLIKSPIWAQLMDTQRELREMPTRLVREAGLEEDLKELKKTQQEINSTTRELRNASQELRNIDITGGASLKPAVNSPVKTPADPVSPQNPSQAGTPPLETSPEKPAEVENDDHSIAPPDLAEKANIETEASPVEEKTQSGE